MTEPVREQVIDYLLGDLEEAEKAELRARLESDPACRDALQAAFRVLLRLHRSRPDDPAPAGLAERTCAAMFDPHQRRRLCLCRRRTMTPATAAGGHPPAGRGRASWVDVGVTCAIFFVAGLLVLPAVNGSRFQARLAACQSNLQRVGLALAEHSYRNHQVFPSVPDKGNLAADGIWAPVLKGEGLLVESQSVLCPETPLAQQGDFQIPSLNELRRAAGRELAQLQGRMGGSYGYCLGYFDHGVLQPTRNLNRGYFAILADAPSDRPDHQSANHDFLGQNVLFDDFHVEFCSTSRPVDGGDDIYVNDNNEVAPGRQINDSVLASSGTPPLVFVNLRNAH